MGATTYSDTPYVTLTAGSALAANIAVKLNSSNLVVPATAADIPLGYTTDDCDAAASGDAVTIRLHGKGGTVKAKQAGAITNGAAVYMAADGKVQAAPAVPTSGVAYIRIGTKLGPVTGAAGDVIEIADSNAVSTVLDPASLDGSTLAAGFLSTLNGTGADASSAAVDLTVTGAVAGLRIVAVVDITDGIGLDPALFTAAAGKITQASGNYASDKLIFFVIPAAAA
jgi:hypothetical protein